MITFQDILEANKRIAPYFVKTSVEYSNELSKANAPQTHQPLRLMSKVLLHLGKN